MWASVMSSLDLAPKEPKVYDPDPTLDLNKILKEYHDFADVFSRYNANKLAEHWPYDVKINLKEGKSPPLGTMYSLSQIEIEALKKLQMRGSPREMSYKA